MGVFFRNTGFFIRETVTIGRLSGISGLLSGLSLIMIFFLLQLALSGWQISTLLVQLLQQEAEISVYFTPEADSSQRAILIDAVERIDGVKRVTPVDEEAAYKQMEIVLGPEAEALSFFDTNPFEPYLQVDIVIDKLDAIVRDVNILETVDYVRDNKTVLDKLKRFAQGITAVGMGIAVAVGACTFVITSHIIREGVHRNKDHIATLKLLGAPDWFIDTPFVYGGILLSSISAGLSIGMMHLSAAAISGSAGEWLTFIPLAAYEGVQVQTAAGVMCFSVLIGLAASVFGLKIIKQR